jgi:Arc/MetJ-type ribon-helix-helix transcriptional regulator
MPTISVKLPVRLESRLRQAVVRRRSTRSALVREALEAHLAREAADAPEESCLGLGSDLAGSITGPPDLSSNPRRLRGYGR